MITWVGVGGRVVSTEFHLLPLPGLWVTQPCQFFVVIQTAFLNFQGGFCNWNSYVTMQVMSLRFHYREPKHLEAKCALKEIAYFS